MNIKILTQKDVRQSVSMPQAIDAIQRAFISFAQNEATLPLRTQVPVKEHGGIIIEPE